MMRGHPNDAWSSETSGAVNFDKTENVVWRVSDLSLPALLKNIVIHCGTNNISKNAAYDIVISIIYIALFLLS